MVLYAIEGICGMISQYISRGEKLNSYTRIAMDTRQTDLMQGARCWPRIRLQGDNNEFLPDLNPYKDLPKPLEQLENYSVKENRIDTLTV
jgi:hypothetical protein